MLRLFAKDRSGASAIEYALIVAVLSLAIVAGLSNTMNSIEFLFANNTSRLNQSIKLGD